LTVNSTGTGLETPSVCAVARILTRNAVVDIVIANNILYSPDTPIIESIANARAVRLLHNTIWGRHNGSEGKLATDEAVEANEQPRSRSRQHGRFARAPFG
jgi:hypothetical protein